MLAGTGVGGASLGGLGTSGAAGRGATITAAGRLNGGPALGGVPGHQGATSFGGPGGQSGAPPSQCGSSCAQTSPGGGTRFPSIPNTGPTTHKIVTTVKGILPGTSGGSTSPSTIVHHVTSTAGSAVHHVTSGAGSAVHHVTGGAGSAVHHVSSGAGSAVHHVASGAGSVVHHIASSVGSAVHHLLP